MRGTGSVELCFAEAKVLISSAVFPAAPGNAGAAEGQA